MQNPKIRLMCVTGVFTALIYVLTAYLHVPSHMGYVHVGDGLIFLAACMLPTPYAMFAGAAGAALADCLTGFVIWAPASAIIKGLTVLLFTAYSGKILSRRNFLALLPAAALCIGGYYLYEAILTGNFISPAADIPGNLIQSLFSSILFVLLGLGFDRFHMKNILFSGRSRS